MFLASTVLLTTSCASIVSKTRYPISINSAPSEANISITDRKGKEIYTGTTPATLELKSGSGFFTRASYLVKFEKEGYDTKTIPVQFKLDEWYFGNLVFGGFIGFLIVDPATGAMFKLSTPFLTANLMQATADATKEELNVYSINDIPEHWKAHLVLLEE